MSRFLCVGSCAFGAVTFFGTTFFDAVFFGLVFLTGAFVFISTPVWWSSSCGVAPRTRNRDEVLHDHTVLDHHARLVLLHEPLAVVRRKSKPQLPGQRYVRDHLSVCRRLR